MKKEKPCGVSFETFDLHITYTLFPCFRVSPSFILLIKSNYKLPKNFFVNEVDFWMAVNKQSLTSSPRNRARDRTTPWKRTLRLAFTFTSATSSAAKPCWSFWAIVSGGESGFQIEFDRAQTPSRGLLRTYVFLKAFDHIGQLFS